MDTDKLINGWIQRYQVIEVSGDDAPAAKDLFWAFRELDDMCRRQPREAWAVVLEILGRTDNEFVLNNLAAGPLETLLAHHGAELIDHVEAQAENNSRFRWLLAGVWKNIIPDEIWRRVQRAAEDSRSVH